MKRITNKLILGLLTAIIFVDFYKAPPPPPNGGGGPSTPGAPSSPIDMYIYLLGFIAIILVSFYVRRMKANKI